MTGDEGPPATAGFPMWALLTALLVSPGQAGSQDIPAGEVAADAAFSSPRFMPDALQTDGLRAQILPHDHTTLATELAARIVTIHVPEGGRFKRGDRLVSLDCDIQKAQLAKARATLVAAEKVSSVNAKLAKMKSMGALEAVTSAAEAAKAQADVRLMAATVKKCTLTAPFSGRVAEQKAREHQYLQAGQPILDIHDDSHLEVEFIVPSRWLSWIRPGIAFILHLDETGRPHSARLTRVGARVDALSQSIKITGELTGPVEELLPGMSGRVEIHPPAGPESPPPP